ncbi:MAG: hypothetical protein EOM55_00575 [Clostridia bacterium]|nr:hypothetical protein [Clostridia bacterium]
MKKKIAVLLVFLFSFISVLTGCNLFDTNNYAALSSIVATSGDISITRENLINGYNNGGYQYYSSYGYTAEQSFKLTIEELVNQEYMLDYIDNLADEKYTLTSDDYRKIVSNCWDYMKSSLNTYVEQVRNDFKLSSDEVTADEEEIDPDYDPQASYETKFVNIFGNAVLIQTLKEDTLTVKNDVTLTTYNDAINYAINSFKYKKYISGSSSDYKALVWRKYLTALKTSQKSYGYTDMTDSAVFEREMTRLFESNYKSQKLTKFEEIYEANNGYTYDPLIQNEDGTTGAYVVSSARLEEIVSVYKERYLENMATYNNLSTKFYGDLTGTTNRKNYVYYGQTSDETLITCTHILIKLSDDQTSAISTAEANTKLSSEAITTIIKNLKSTENTYATERDLETGENVLDENGNEVKISVKKLYENLENALKNKTNLTEIVEIFNSYLYKYNVDTGIINAEYDYVVGTETSAMVESFTDSVRNLYNNGTGKVGSMDLIFEENDNYTGYHIVLYTGTLKNLFTSRTELNTLTFANVFSKLTSEKTSISYNQTLFEKLFDEVAKDNYSTYRNNLVATLKNGINTIYQTNNFSDLYN